jgi:hypothetical protein
MHGVVLMSSGDFAATVLQAHRIKNEIKALEEEYDRLLGSLGDLDERDYPAGDFILRVTPTLRFEAATARRNLSYDEFACICELTPTSAKAKKVLEDRYHLTQRRYGVTKRILRVEDAENYH